MRSCPQCHRAKYVHLQKAYSKLQTVHILDKVWNQITMDLIGTLMDIEGCKYMLIVINYFTKWFDLSPLKTKSGEEVGMALFKLMI